MMSESRRKSFVEMLFLQYCADTTLHNKCCEESRNAINQGWGSRMFQDFPQLLDQEEVKKQTVLLQRMIENTQVQFDVENLDANTKAVLEEWVRKIAKIGIRELFD